MEHSVVVRFGRYLSGEMNAAEKEAFMSEIEADQQLKAEFMAYQRTWSLSSAPDVSWDSQAAWNRFVQHEVEEPATTKTYRLRLGWAVAASFLILATTAWFLFLRPNAETYRYAEQGDNTIELKDGSVVHLNRGSAITVFPFSAKTRKVELSGEAFFDVAPDAAKPFFIECGKTITEVIGTAFNIRQSGDDVMLFVRSGKVIFRSEDTAHSKALALTAGEAAVYENEELRMIPNPTPNASAWHTRQLWFKGMALSDVVSDCTGYFNQAIRIENEQAKSCTIRITLPFKDPEIEKTLATVAKTINAEVVMDEDVYVIKGGSCPQDQ